MRKRNKTQVPAVEVDVTTIPESCGPGGVNEGAWQDAYAALMQAPDEASAENALARMRALGMEDTRGVLQAS